MESMEKGQSVDTQYIPGYSNKEQQHSQTQDKILEYVKSIDERLRMLEQDKHLENCTAQPQDTPLQKEKDAMADRLQQRVYVGTDEFGKPQYRAAYGRDTQELLLNCARLLVGAGMVEGMQTVKHQDANIPLFGDYLADFHTSFKRKLAPTTKETYRQLIQKHIIPALGSMPIDQIKTTMIQQLFDDMADAGLSAETIKKVRNIIKPALALAVEENHIRINPANSINLRINTDKQGGHVALPPEKVAEIKAGLQNLPDDQRRLMALLVYTGQRIGEVLGLRWEDVDCDNKEIHILRAVTHPDKNQPVVGKPKTKTSQRDIPLISPLLEALCPMQKEGYIVSGDRPWTFAEERRRWKKIQVHFGIEDYTHHDFRDTCATDWREAGIPLEVVSKLLGHADISTTAKHYVRPRGKTLQEAGRLMERTGNAPFASTFASASTT